MTSKQISMRFVYVFLLGAILSLPAFAQSTTDGAIGGTVKDQSGALLPDASVTARNQGTNSTTAGEADSGGRFLIVHLQPGPYTIEVSASGFKTYSQTDVIVEVGRVTPLDVLLSVGSHEQKIEVTGEAPVVNTEQPDFSSNVNQITINNLPINGRRWSTFALLTPGAAPDGNFGLITFRGISGLLNNNTVDGGDNTQAFFAEERGRTRISYSVSEASIQEFQVNTSNYSAEYGRSAGGVVNAVTKSGTNEIHGGLFYYIRDNALGAFNPFATETIVVNGVGQVVPIKPFDRRQQFGGDVGGPVIKDKVFFFFSYDQQKRSFPGIAAASNPAQFFGPITVTPPTGNQVCPPAKPPAGTPALTDGQVLFCRGFTQAQANDGLAFLQSLTGSVSRTGDQTIFFPKFDWKITPSNTLSVDYNRLRWDSPFGIQTSAVVFRGVDSFGSDFVKEDWGTARLVSIISPALTNEFRFQYGRDFEFENSQPAIPGEPTAGGGRSPQIDIFGVGSFTFGKPNFLERRAFPDERRTQFADTLSYSWGRHLFKFGTDINRVHDLEDNLFQEGGEYSYNTRADFITDYENNIQNAHPPSQTYSSFSQGIGPTAFKFKTWDLAFFGQDDWRVLPRLTLSLGLRWEYEILPSPQIPNSALPSTTVFADDRNNLGPRVGAAWDIRGNGKSVLRGGYGIYYGRIINSTIANAITNVGSPLGQLSFQIFPGPTAPFYPAILSSANPSVGHPDVIQFAPNTQNPLVHEFDVIFEQEIAHNTAVSVSYIGSLGRHLPLFIDTNLFPPNATTTYTISGGPLNGQTVTLPLFTGPRPNTGFGRITDISYIGKSKYNGVVLQVNRRMSRGLQFQASYTYSKSTDENQTSQTFTTGNNVLNPFDLGAEVGVSSFDFRHRFVSGLVWQPNHFRNEGGIKHALLDGYTLSPIVTATSGAPFTGSVSGNAPNPSASIKTTSFGILGAGGSNRPPFVPRNDFRLPRTANVDFRISRRFGLGEKVNLEVIGEAFNLFNHVNATAVNTTQYTIPRGTSELDFNSTFGTVTNGNNSFSFTPRQIQLALRLDF